MEENPFPDLSIDCTNFLDEINGRSPCSKCGRSRKYYCYTCYLPVPEVADKVPNIQLPIKVDIIKHPSEVDGKSTAIHAGVIAPDDVMIYTYPCIPDYEDKSKVVLIFPGKDAVSLSDLATEWKVKQKHTVTSDLKRKLESCDDDTSKSRVDNIVPLKVCKTESDTEKCSTKSDNSCISETLEGNDKAELSPLSSDNSTNNTNVCDDTICEVKVPADTSGTMHLEKDSSEPAKTCKGSIRSRLVPGCPLERVVFVDSTWNQTKTICGDERLQGLTHIELQTRTTKFWRHQRDIPDTYLSTIEAIYYFVRDFHEHFVQSEYTAEYDNLLFFFKYMYSKIRNIYDGGNDLKAYKERKPKKESKP